MKKQLLRYLSFISFVLLFIGKTHAQNPVNWTEKQLIQPSELAGALQANKNLPVIISVGPGAIIPGSIDAGMASNEDGLKRLKSELKNTDRNQRIVIYCGCCPFEHCPNVRPAIDALKEMNFTNYFLLNLPHNIKKDWIDQGYPVNHK
jgi:hypothetical protein